MSLSINSHVPIQPQHVSAPVGGQQGQIGGMAVHQTETGGVRRALSEVANTVKSFFSGLATRFENWQEGRAVASATKAGTKSAEAFADAIKGGTIGPEAQGPMESMMKHAARANPGQPEVAVAQFMREGLATLSPGDRNKACFADFTATGTAMKGVVDQRIDEANAMMEGLAEVGLAKGPQDGDAGLQKTAAHARIDTFIGGLKTAAREQRVADLASFTSGTCNVAPDGRFTGTVVNGELPKALTGDLAAPRAAHGPVHTPASFIEGRGQARLDSHASGEKRFETHSGIPISSSATGDFHRMDIGISHNGQTFNTKLPPGSNDQIPANVTASVNALRGFSGSDEATTVLSGVLHQYEMREIVHIFAGADGGAIDFKPMLGGYDHAQVLQPNGHVETFDDPGQIGDAKIRLSKTPAGDFKVDVTWDYLSLAVSDGKESLPVDPGNPRYRPNNPVEAAVVPTCLKIAMTGSFVISAADAAQGRLRIDPNAVFQQTVSGQVALPN